MKKLLFVFGTRPEAIKLIPLILDFRKYPRFHVTICVTAQHRLMLDQVLDFFAIIPDYDLDIMAPNQDLHSLTANILVKLKPVLEDVSPDYVFVHGDTTTTLAASLSAFYQGIKVCHVEAGLRTFNKQSPFPEEINRMLVTRLCDLHFAPTRRSYDNLVREKIASEDIMISGNTVIDALFYGLDKINRTVDPEIESLNEMVDFSKRVILVTGHRRENHGTGFINICTALKKIAEDNPDVLIVYPVHFNPNVKDVVNKLLSNIANIKLIDPLSYQAFISLMSRSYFVITDSGGIQEEAPSLGKPVLVLRETTERPEAVEAGTVKLVGTNVDTIVRECQRLLDDSVEYESMSKAHNPYGDGTASSKIVGFFNQI